MGWGCEAAGEARPPTRAKQAVIGLDEGIGRASRERSPQKTRAGVPRFPRPQRREACRADAHGTRPPSPLVRANGERRPDEAMRKGMACRGTRVKGKQAIGLDEGIGQSRPRARDSPSSRPPLALWGVKGSVKTRVQSPTVNEERPCPSVFHRRSHDVGRSTRPRGPGTRGNSDCPLSCSLMSLACLLLLRPPFASFDLP